ncbi:MAG: hypothetical protein GY724_29805 [Actinomycetia bacterium]|nr:hypothetical protein [Actinomycetes bacterium]MCP5032259.1 hypothetical protein [Actinomycetes bacterium]
MTSPTTPPFRAESCDLESFRRLVEPDTDLSQYPNASGVVQGAMEAIDRRGP